MQTESGECQGILFLDQNNNKITKGQLKNFKWKRKAVETLLERKNVCL